MKPMYIIIIILISLDTHARCRTGFSQPIVICNYKQKPKVVKLNDYLEWSEIVFEGIKKTVFQRTVQKEDQITGEVKFSFLTKTMLPTTNYKIVRICNDSGEEMPEVYVLITAPNLKDCKNQPASSLVYQ